jgi:iron complex transport system ATP-binding protein
VIAVLHDLAMAARWCDRLLVLDGGHMVADGTPTQVLTPQRLEQTYGIKAFFGGDPACPLIIPMGRTL